MDLISLPLPPPFSKPHAPVSARSKYVHRSISRSSRELGRQYITFMRLKKKKKKTNALTRGVPDGFRHSEYVEFFKSRFHLETVLCSILFSSVLFLAVSFHCRE